MLAALMKEVGEEGVVRWVLALTVAASCVYQ